MGQLIRRREKDLRIKSASHILARKMLNDYLIILQKLFFNG